MGRVSNCATRNQQHTRPSAATAEEPRKSSPQKKAAQKTTTSNKALTNAVIAYASNPKHHVRKTICKRRSRQKPSQHTTASQRKAALQKVLRVTTRGPPANQPKSREPLTNRPTLSKAPAETADTHATQHNTHPPASTSHEMPSQTTDWHTNQVPTLPNSPALNKHTQPSPHINTPTTNTILTTLRTFKQPMTSLQTMPSNNYQCHQCKTTARRNAPARTLICSQYRTKRYRAQHAQ